MGKRFFGQRAGKKTGALLLALAGAPAGAGAQTSLYTGYNQSQVLTFFNPIQGGLGPTLHVQVNGGPTAHAIVDTGSAALVLAKNLVNTTGLQSLGAGAVYYSSDNRLLQGTYYNIPVTITGHNNNSVTSMVQALVTDIADSFAYMGIGFDRGGTTGATANNPLYPTASMNALLNVTQLGSTAVTNMRRGYIIDGKTNSITIGLTGAMGGYTLMKLAPNTVAGNPSLWARAQMGVTVNGQALGTGNFVPDTGISYMILVSSTASITAPPANSTFSINLTPGLPAELASSYSFTTGPGGSGTARPSYVEVLQPMSASADPLGSDPAVNSGQAFYSAFSYLFDYDGGYVGYSGTGVVPVLALTGAVTLPGVFASTLPTFLTGNTTLQATGQSATFDAPVSSSGSSLTLGGGAFTFNQGINLGSGGFVVQQGSAAINGGLTAAAIVIAAAGTLANGSASTITGSVLNAGTLANGGTIAGNVVNVGVLTNVGTITGNVANTGVIAGTGAIAGNLVHAGTIAPGNSIGTVAVAGSYAQLAGSVYQVEVNSAGQSDLISVGGTAVLQGGAAVVSILPGSPLPISSRYTIVSAAGGLSGTFESVNELYPFLQSSLSYDANNAYLNLQVGGFAAQALNNTQYATGAVLDANAPNATGDFASVLGSLATATAQQGQAFMTAISGNNYAGFSSSMVQGAQLFMNNFANQTGGGGSPVANRVALAEACDVACDATTPAKWGAWGGALGGLGTIGANQPVGAVTYNVGGFAAGLDRLATDTIRLGVTAGYTNGTQWVGGFDGLGRSDTFQVGLYGGFAQDKVYADAVIGYAYTWNQMWRNIPVPGLGTRTAQGRTGANQFYGQIETGYRVDLGTTANAFVTPFVRLQAFTGTQNAFSETGAQSLNLSVAQQTTNSLRSVIGAQLGGSMDLGWREKLALQLRLGWSHEYADVGRPVSATLAGAPAMAFTTYGVSPQRDGVVLGLAANTAIAEATSIYLRYEGDISGQDSAHALTAGVRMTW